MVINTLKKGGIKYSEIDNNLQIIATSINCMLDKRLPHTLIIYSFLSISFPDF